MKVGKVLTLLFAAMLLNRGMAVAQIPVEVFGGSKKATMDLMFFKYFKNESGSNSRFLFFNRNRAIVDYKMDTTNYLPQFGFTEAISYNHEKLKGLAPVIVAQVLGSGVYPKAGVQYAYINNRITIFSWLVCETRNKPNMDLFFLGRYTPKLTEKIQLFSQFELINAVPTVSTKNYSFTQRIRLGLKLKELQFGCGGDISEIGRRKLETTDNIGLFLRYEY